MDEITFDAPIWEHDGNASWHFVSVPEDHSDDIAEVTAGMTRGFGSVRVEVELGPSRWRTSLFPDTKRGCYILPMKKAVRKANGVGHGDVVAVTLRLIDL